MYSMANNVDGKRSYVKLRSTEKLDDDLLDKSKRRWIRDSFALMNLGEGQYSMMKA